MDVLVINAMWPRQAGKGEPLGEPEQELYRAGVSVPVPAGENEREVNVVSYSHHFYGDKNGLQVALS